jgi:hypothetical protein
MSKDNELVQQHLELAQRPAYDFTIDPEDPGMQVALDMASYMHNNTLRAAFPFGMSLHTVMRKQAEASIGQACQVLSTVNVNLHQHIIVQAQELLQPRRVRSSLRPEHAHLQAYAQMAAGVVGGYLIRQALEPSREINVDDILSHHPDDFSTWHAVRPPRGINPITPRELVGKLSQRYAVALRKATQLGLNIGVTSA